MLRTIRGRLIAGLAALLFIACATVGVVSYFAAQKSMLGTLHNQLQTATSLTNTCLDSQIGHDGDGDGDGDGDDRGSPGPIQGFRLDCPGLGNGTFWAYIRGSHWIAGIVPRSVTLSAADKATLLAITPTSPPSSSVPIETRDLPSAGGEFALTVFLDPHGAIYVTGLPLSSLHDMLRGVALAELIVFGLVLVAAGAGGTIWVRLSLRPLHRVAATATAVAELPLESGEIELPKGVPYTDPGTETGQVGAAFNRMLGHVETALQRRVASEARLRRFAADASHELRTPLAAIRGYAELALRHPGKSPEAVTHAMGRVLSESTRMSVLVDDLLLLARLDAGRPLSREPVDMSRLAIDATSDSRVARPGHRWVLDLPDDPVLVCGDNHRLHQVLANLLGNAGRHTPEGTTVTVKLSAVADPPAEADLQHGAIPAAPRMVLTVTDDGPGIPPDLLPDLFERFTRADTSRSHAAGASSTGLGLAIVDAVVAAHDGAVVVTSRPGLTRFAIVLPRLAEPAAEPERPRQGRKSLHR
jgi:two-component system, OmpR family, sensor kinase